MDTSSAVDPDRPARKGIPVDHEILASRSADSVPANATRAISKMSSHGTRPSGDTMTCCSVPASRTRRSAGWILTRALSFVEHEITLPPYMSVGFPTMPTRPGADAVRVPFNWTPPGAYLADHAVRADHADHLIDNRVESWEVCTR